MRPGLFPRSMLICLACLAAARHAHPQAATPSTPAGEVMTAFLSAFNSADRQQLEAYVRRYDGTATADELLAFSGSTGGFSILSVRSSAPDDLKVLFQGRSDGVISYADLRLAATTPERVKSFIIRALPPGAPIEDVPLTPATRQQTLDLLAEELSDDYVKPMVALQMVSRLRKEDTSGAYKTVTDGNEFAGILTQDLQSISHDAHLFVAYSPAVSPEGNAGAVPGPAEIARYRGAQKRDNCSFSEARILPRNIGYLKFNEFADPVECGPTLVAAMGFVAHVDALIVDLRDNHGGQPTMVQLILSYFFDKPTHLNDIYIRPEDATRQYWTLPYVPGLRLIDTPLYVLTSNRTFSGAEEFTNDLKSQKRATIVGERTKGGAHPLNTFPIGDHFVAGIPIGRPINPITQDDWEGTGVAPDVETPEADALAIAQKLATARILAAEKPH